MPGASHCTCERIRAPAGATNDAILFDTEMTCKSGDITRPVQDAPRRLEGRETNSRPIWRDDTNIEFQAGIMKEGPTFPRRGEAVEIEDWAAGGRPSVCKSERASIR